MIARDPAYLPYIREQLTEEVVAKYFAHAFEVKKITEKFLNYGPFLFRVKTWSEDTTCLV